MYSIDLSTSDLLCFIISNTDKHEFSSIWKSISCSKDVRNHVDCVIKRDFYPKKMIHVLKRSVVYNFLALKISVIYKRNIS